MLPFVRRGVLLYRARHIASSMVDFPLPVSPQMRKIGESDSGADVKSMLVEEIDAMLVISSFFSFMVSVVFFRFHNFVNGLFQQGEDILVNAVLSCFLQVEFCYRVRSHLSEFCGADIYLPGGVYVLVIDLLHPVYQAELGKMGPYSVAELYLKETGQEGIDENILALLKETIDEVMNPEKHD